MPATKKKDPQQTDFERVVRWRFEALLEMGLSPDQAVCLIEVPDIVHAAQELYDKGCPPQIIASLLGE